MFKNGDLDSKRDGKGGSGFFLHGTKKSSMFDKKGGDPKTRFSVKKIDRSLGRWGDRDTRERDVCTSSG